MSLVQYSDSESSGSSTSEDLKRRGTKRRRLSNAASSLPPLPDTFHDLYASTTRLSKQDDPALHGGRQRVTPHIEGNWPTHIYIEWHPSTEQSNHLHKFLTSTFQTSLSADDEIHSLLRSDLGTELPLHISLSRPITLQTSRREPFTDALLNGISKSNTRPFEISVLTLDWVVNYEKTRWFLVMKVSKPPHNELNQLLSISNATAQSFGQLPLYTTPRPPPSNTKHRKTQTNQPQPHRGTNPLHPAADMSSSFHVSIAWTLSPPSQALRDFVERSSDEIQGLKINVQAVKAKIGNNVTSIPLASRIDGSNQIIEKCRARS